MREYSPRRIYPVEVETHRLRNRVSKGIHVDYDCGSSSTDTRKGGGFGTGNFEEIEYKYNQYYNKLD